MKIKTSWKLAVNENEDILKKTMEKVYFVELQEKRYFNDSV